MIVLKIEINYLRIIFILYMRILYKIINYIQKFRYIK